MPSFRLFKFLKKFISKNLNRRKIPKERRHPRFSGEVSSRGFIAKYSKGNKLLGHVNNFSRSGLSFDSKEKIRLKKKIKISLQLSGLNKKIPAIIKIVWHKEKKDCHIFGAEFIDISPEYKFEILDLLFKDWKQSIKEKKY